MGIFSTRDFIEYGQFYCADVAECLLNFGDCLSTVCPPGTLTPDGEFDDECTAELSTCLVESAHRVLSAIAYQDDFWGLDDRQDQMSSDDGFYGYWYTFIDQTAMTA